MQGAAQAGIRRSVTLLGDESVPPYDRPPLSKAVLAGPTVLHGALGAVGTEFEPWWSEVDLRLGVLADRVEDGAVHLVGGEIIEADAVLVGIGAPVGDWLVGRPRD